MDAIERVVVPPGLTAGELRELLRRAGAVFAFVHGSRAAGTHRADSDVDVAALVLAIPSAVLAVIDIADRIRKRRRAKQLIDRAGEIRITHTVEIYVLTGAGMEAVAGLTRTDFSPSPRRRSNPALRASHHAADPDGHPGEPNDPAGGPR